MFVGLRRRSSQFILILVSISLVFTWTSCSPTPPEDAKTSIPPAEGIAHRAEPRQPLSVGDPIQLVQAQVQAAGGEVVVDKPGDPLHGLTVQVPPGSYSGTVTFALSSAPIKEHYFDVDVRILTPLIRVDNGGGYAEEYMGVTIPIDISDREFAMAFLYDGNTGALEGLTTAALSSKSITAVTTHFSDLFVIARDKERLDRLDIHAGYVEGRGETKFLEGRDDWDFPNEGSIVSPIGICQGMCLTQMWYFVNEKPIDGQPLRAHNTNGLGPGRETPHFWPDDSWAIKLASMAQVSVEKILPKFSEAVFRAFQVETSRVTRELGREEYKPPLNRINFYTIAMALEITRQPQLVSVNIDSLKVHHAVVCYRIDKRRLYLADPNFVGPNPGRNYVDYDDGDGGRDGGDGSFTPYETALTSKDWKEGRRISFTRIAYASRTSLLGDHALQRYWLDFKSDQIGRVAYLPDKDNPDPLLRTELLRSNANAHVFPEYTLRITERDEKGARVSEYELDRLNGAAVRHKDIEVAVRSATALTLHIYRFEDVQEWEKSYTPETRGLPKRVSNGRVTLRPGPNLLGFHLEGGREPAWAGFDWITVVYEPASVAPILTPTPSRATATPTPRAAVQPQERRGVFAEGDCACMAELLPCDGATTEQPSSAGLRCEQDHCIERHESKIQQRVARFEIEWQNATRSLQVMEERRKQAQTFITNHCRKDYEECVLVEDTSDRVLYYHRERPIPGSISRDWRCYGTREILVGENFPVRMRVRLTGNVACGEAEVTEVLDKLEKCALAAIEAYGRRASPR